MNKVASGNRSFSERARQAWTIARIELRRAFFAKRGLWVYALAVLPAVVFFGHAVDMRLDIARLTRHDNETAEIHLKGRGDVLPVSRQYVHLFRQM